MQVVEQQHDGCGVARGEPAKHLRGGMEATVAYLPPVLLDAFDVLAAAEVEPDQVPEQMGMSDCLIVALAGREQRRDALFELLFRQRHAVAIGDLQAPGQHVAQQPTGLVARLRVGTALEQAEGLGARIGPVLELAHQAALADAGFGHHRDGHQPALREHAQEGGLQLRQFGVTPDHARGHALDAARRHTERARSGTQHEHAGDGRIDALHFDGGLWLHIEHAAHTAPGVVADAQAAGRCRLLHAGCDVHRQPADAGFGVDPAAQQHAAGVHAHAHIEPGPAMALQHLLALRTALREQGQAGQHRALGIIFLGGVATEDGQQVVARVLQHLAAMRIDDGRAARERAVEHGMDVFRVEVLAQRGGADDVEKQHADLPQCLVGGHCGQRRLQGRELGAQRIHRQVDHRITEQRALRFEASDGGCQRLLFGAHDAGAVIFSRA